MMFVSNVRYTTVITHSSSISNLGYIDDLFIGVSSDGNTISYVSLSELDKRRY